MNNQDAYRLFHKGILAMQKAEENGLRIDVDYSIKEKKRLTSEIESLEKELSTSNFFLHWKHYTKGHPNINSNTQLANFLYNGRKLKPAKTTAKGNGATDEEALRLLNIPELNIILKIRKLKKVRDTYLDAYLREQVNGYLHPFFNLHTVATYRSSSSNPNFQNIPKRDKEAMKIVRNAIFARPGHQLMEVDFSGLEVSIAACYHKDPVMLDYLIHKKDMHGDMAKQIFMVDTFNKDNKYHKVLRYAAKNGFVFPQFYGDYYRNNAHGLCDVTKLPTVGIWKKSDGVLLNDETHIGEWLSSQGLKNFESFVKHIQKIEDDFWNNRFKVYGRWKRKWFAEYERNGYFQSYTGFTFKGVFQKNEVINYPVQGAAFHCLLWCFIRLDEIFQQRGFKTRMLGQIHDAIVLDVSPPELAEISKIIYQVTSVELAKTWDWIIVPLHVEAELGEPDASWATLEEFDLLTCKYKTEK